MVAMTRNEGKDLIARTAGAGAAVAGDAVATAHTTVGTADGIHYTTPSLFQ